MTDSLNPLVAVKYWRIVRNLLMSVGAWPGKDLGEEVTTFTKFMSLFIQSQTVIMVFGEIHFLYNNNSKLNFLLKGQCYIVFYLSFITLSRACYMPYTKNYGILMKNFFFTFHLVYHKHKGEYYEKIYKTVEKYARLAAIYYLSALVIGPATYTTQPTYHNYKMGLFSGEMDENSKPEFAIYYSAPGYDPNEYFWTTTFMNLWLTYVFVNCFCLLDLLVTIMCIHIIGHFVIFKNNIRSIPRPKGKVSMEINGMLVMVDSYDAEENKCLHVKLVEFVEHHRLIVRFTQNVSDFFGLMLVFNYSVHLFSGCLLLVEISIGGMTALLQFGVLTLSMVVQLVVSSVLFEVVSSQSEQLVNIVYNMPWECMDHKNQRTFIFLLQRIQTPVVVTGLGLARVGVQTMAGVMKTTFSYYMFLHNLEL